MGRRGQALTVAAFVAGAGLVSALVVLPSGWEHRDRPPGGEPILGTATLEPDLLQPLLPGTGLRSSRDRGILATPRDGARRPGGEPSNHPAAGQLGVSLGSVDGLYPGHRVKLGVRYVNPFSFPIAIETVQVTASGTKRCTAAQLRPTRPPRLRIPSRSSIASSIRVGMRRTAPDACQGVRFAIRVRVTAVQS